MWLEKRAPMRFGKREYVYEPEGYQMLRSARAPMRFGKRFDFSKRAPSSIRYERDILKTYQL